MELRFEGQFDRDINISDRQVLSWVADVVKRVEVAENISQIPGLKKLRKYKTQYRIKVADDYRIGVVIRGNVVWFVRFGHRSLFYKRFP